MLNRKLLNIYYYVSSILADMRGQGITEYGLNILFVAIALIAVLVLFRSYLFNYYSDVVIYLNGI